MENISVEFQPNEYHNEKGQPHTNVVIQTLSLKRELILARAEAAHKEQLKVLSSMLDNMLRFRDASFAGYEITSRDARYYSIAKSGESDCVRDYIGILTTEDYGDNQHDNTLQSWEVVLPSDRVDNVADKMLLPLLKIGFLLMQQCLTPGSPIDAFVRNNYNKHQSALKDVYPLERVVQAERTRIGEEYVEELNAKQAALSADYLKSIGDILEAGREWTFQDDSPLYAGETLQVAKVTKARVYLADSKYRKGRAAKNRGFFSRDNWEFMVTDKKATPDAAKTTPI